MKPLTYNLTGKSLLDLKADGMRFWSDWWEDQDFAKVKGRKGEMTMYPTQSKGKTYDYCEKNLNAGTEIASASEYLEFLWLHFKKTGKYLLESEWTWTNTRASDGVLVMVGYFNSDGVRVRGNWPDYSNSSVGVCPSRFKELGTRKLGTTGKLVLGSKKISVTKPTKITIEITIK